MRRRQKVLLVVGAGLLTAALAITVWLALAGETKVAQRPGALAVVLLPGLNGSTLAVVDLESGDLLRSIRLRSLVTDLATDEETGLVVGAQSGGIGSSADNAASLVDPRSGRVRYVTLPWPDPTRVTCVGSRAFMLHSVVDEAGLAVSVVDPSAGSVVATGHVPDGSGAWTSAGGSVWSLAVASSPVPFTLTRSDPGTLAVSERLLDGIAPIGLAEASGTLLVLGREKGTEGPGGAALVGLIDVANGTARVSRPLAGLAHDPSLATVAGDRLIVGDWVGEEPETRGVLRLDVATLRPAGPIPIDGVPCALGSWGGRLLVVDRERGRLLQLDPDSGKVLQVTGLGVRDLAYSRVVVVPGR